MSLKLFFLFILFGLGLIALSIYLFVSEINEAKEFCDSEKGIYSFREWKHTCNGTPIYEYTILGKTFWSFELNFENQTVNPLFLTD